MVLNVLKGVKGVIVVKVYVVVFGSYCFFPCSVSVFCTLRTLQNTPKQPQTLPKLRGFPQNSSEHVKGL